jgi:hypothetical protein
LANDDFNHEKPHCETVEGKFLAFQTVRGKNSDKTPQKYVKKSKILRQQF